jgi:DNA-binding beta-propeller fold protein YncE
MFGHCKSCLTARVVAATLGLIAAQSAVADQLLVLEKDTQTLAIIDPTTLKVLARAPAGTDPHEVVASDDGTRAYISNYGGEGSALHILSVVDLRTHQALSAIDLGALHSAHGLDFVAGKVYFTAESSKAIGSYDPAQSRIDWVMGTGQARTHMICVARDLKHIYTTDVRSGTVSILESSERRAFGPPPQAMVTIWDVTHVPSGRGAEGFDLSPDGRQLWAANSQDGTVTVIDLASKQASETFPIPVHGANRLKFTLDGRYVLISALGVFGSTQPQPDHNNLVVLDAASHKLVKAFDLGGGAAGILIAPNGMRAFIAVSGGDKVAVIDLKTLSVSAEIAPLRQPDGMAWARDAAPDPRGTDEQGATVRCRDGTYVHGTVLPSVCSGHGGVEKWLRGPPQELIGQS